MIKQCNINLVIKTETLCHEAILKDADNQKIKSILSFLKYQLIPIVSRIYCPIQIFPFLLSNITKHLVYELILTYFNCDLLNTLLQKKYFISTSVSYISLHLFLKNNNLIQTFNNIVV